MKVSDVCSLMEQWAPSGYAYTWDRTGLRIGDPSATVKSVVVALTVDRKTFALARRVKAQLVVAHHPVLWEPLKTLRTDDPLTRLYLDFAEAGIACYGSHTSLDIVADGVNDVLAERLGLIHTEPLFPVDHVAQLKLVTFVPASHLDVVRDAVCTAGAGVIGDYTHCSFSAPGTGTFRPTDKASPYSGKKQLVNAEPEHRFEVIVNAALVNRVVAALRQAHPYEEVAYDLVQLQNKDRAIGIGRLGRLKKPVTLGHFAKEVRSALGLQHVRLVGESKRRVERVAVMGGAGASSVNRVPANVDVYVTGDVGYHDAHDAILRNLAVIDAGHHGTERWIVPAIAQYLKRMAKGLRVTTYMENDPFVSITG